MAEAHGLDPAKIIDFSVSINPLGLSPRAKKVILKDGPAAALRYPDPRCSGLRKALAGIHRTPEACFLPGPGSTEFIHSLPRRLKLKKALLVTPAGSGYESALESGGGEIHFFETREEDGFELDVEGLMLALTQGYDALYLCNPNNPTGILTERRDLLRILARTEEQKTWFILDEAFIDFVPGESLLSEAPGSSRLVILRSLSHFHALPGLRAGYLVSNPEAVRDLSLSQEPWRVSALAQLAAAESLRDRAFVERTLEFIPRERESLVHELRGIPGFIPYPGSANYLLVQLHPSLNLTAGELAERLVPRRILIRDCRSFHHLGPYFFRMAIRTSRENQSLLKALRQIHKEIIRA
jgi:threonine-phosphate decarboxylase